VASTQGLTLVTFSAQRKHFLRDVLNSVLTSSLSPLYLLETDGLFTQRSRTGRTVGGSVGAIFEMDCSEWQWSKGIQYQIFDTRPDTEFKWWFQ